MRPIDADELREAMEFCKTISHMQEHAPLIDEFIGAIDDMPTLDAAPVRRGEWVYEKIGDKTRCFCSECGDQPMRFEPNFCPNCGADMRGVSHGTD